MAPVLGQQGVLRVVPPATLDAAIKKQDEDRANAQQKISDVVESSLVAHITSRYEVFRRHRNNNVAGWSDRLIAALRVFNGQYDPEKLAEIKKFGGSEIYARLIAMKCRGASSLLRDVYLSPDRCWGLNPPADPDIPQSILQTISQLVQQEGTSLEAGGQPPNLDTIRDRTIQLTEAARDAAKKRAKIQARASEDKLDEMLTEGGLYKALGEFLTDLPLFPYACIKGPVVRIVPSVDWSTGKAVVKQTPRLFWTRVSPFDIYWTPGVSEIEDAEIIERTRLTRAELNDLLDLPGYNVKAIRDVLDEYGRGGLSDNWDSTDSQRAVEENRENPIQNNSGLIACLEFHGNVQGRMLLEWGMKAKQVPDAMRDYFVQAWMIGKHVIKVQLSPSPRKRHPYFITSFEKVPGTPVGNGLPDLLADIGDAANATLRALINNLSIASGPQVVVNDDRLAADEDGEEMFPWKRWHVTSDPMANSSQVPISFFQPNSNAQELLGIYNSFNQIADEISAIPKSLTGSGAGQGAGRTASGLAMLMGNAAKILQTVAGNIDRDVMEPLLSSLFDMVMLTDTSGLLSGQEEIKVMGVNVAVQKETQRSKQIEFLQATANPIDAQIMGPIGRGNLLREVSKTLGLEGQQVVPPEDEIKAKMQAAEQAAAAQTGQAPGVPHPALAGGAGEQAQGNQPSPLNKDMGPRTNVAGGVG